MEGQREALDGPMGSSGANISNPQEASAPYANTGNAILWTDDLHQDFLQAVDRCGGAFVARPKNIKGFMRSTVVTTTQIKSHLQRHRQRLLNQGGGPSEAPSQGAAPRPLSASQGAISRDPPLPGWSYPTSLAAPLGGMQPPAAKRHRPAQELGASLLTLQSLLGQPQQQPAGTSQALRDQQQQQQPWLGPLGQQQQPLWSGAGGPPPGRPFWGEPPGFVAGPGGHLGPARQPGSPQDSPRPLPPQAADPLDASLPLAQGPRGPAPLGPPPQGPWRLPLPPPPPGLVGAPASMATWLSTMAGPPGDGGVAGPGAMPSLAPPGAAVTSTSMPGDPASGAIAAAAVGGSLVGELQSGGGGADEEDCEEGSYGLLQGIAMLAAQQYRVQQEILEHMQALHGLHARLDSLGAQVLRLASAFHDQQRQQIDEPQQWQQQQQGRAPGAAPQPVLEAAQARSGTGLAGTAHMAPGLGPLVPPASLRLAPREQPLLQQQPQPGPFPPRGMAGPTHGVSGMAWEVPPGTASSVMGQLQELLPLLQQALAHPGAREQLQAIAALASSLPPGQGSQQSPYHLPSLQALAPAQQQQQGEPAGAASFFGRQPTSPYALQPHHHHNQHQHQHQQQQQQGGSFPGYQPSLGGMAAGPLSGQAEPSTGEAIAVLQRFLQQMGTTMASREDERGRTAPRDKESHESLTAYSPAAQEAQQQQEGQAQQQQRHGGHRVQQQQQQQDGHGRQQGEQEQAVKQQQQQEVEQDHSEQQQQQPLQGPLAQAAADGSSDATGRPGSQQTAAAAQAGRSGATEQQGGAGASSSGERQEGQPAGSAELPGMAAPPAGKS